jgi:hypothetical protein
MGLWVTKFNLRPGETVLWEALANHVRHGIAVGGKLAVTDQRLLFQPNRIDKATGRKAWDCPRAAISGVDELPRRPLAILGGGIRQRLAIQTDDGPEVFVINHLDRQVPELRKLLAVARRP